MVADAGGGGVHIITPLSILGQREINSVVGRPLGELLPYSEVRSGERVAGTYVQPLRLLAENMPSLVARFHADMPWWSVLERQVVVFGIHAGRGISWTIGAAKERPERFVT